MTFIFNTSRLNNPGIIGPTFSIGNLSVADATAFLGGLVSRGESDTLYRIVRVRVRFSGKIEHKFKDFEQFLGGDNRISWSL